MNNDMLLWIAQQIGYARAYFDCDGNVRKAHGWPILDLTDDTPQAAYDREKVVEWLGCQHNITFFPANMCNEEEWLPVRREAHVAGGHYSVGGWGSRKQAIIAACEYVWRKEVGDVAKA